MIINKLDDWVSLYGAIKEETSCSDEKHVFIYASAADADSVCALRIVEVGRMPLIGRGEWACWTRTARALSYASCGVRIYPGGSGHGARPYAWGWRNRQSRERRQGSCALAGGGPCVRRARPISPLPLPACHHVQNVLRNDMIPHGWMPVSRYQEIEDDFSKYYRPDEEVRGLVGASLSHAWPPVFLDARPPPWSLC